MHKLADYKDKKDAVAVSDKVYNDIEELKKATTPDPKTGKSEIGLYDLIWFEDTTDNNRRVLCKPMDLFGYHYGSMNQALLAYENGEITLHQNIYVYRKATMADGTEVSSKSYLCTKHFPDFIVLCFSLILIYSVKMSHRIINQYLLTIRNFFRNIRKISIV